MSRILKVALAPDLNARAEKLARDRGLATENNPGVAALIKIALAAYLGKYEKRRKEDEE